MTEGEQRHGCLTAYLMFGIGVNALAALRKNLSGRALIRRILPRGPGVDVAVPGVLNIFLPCGTPAVEEE